MQPKVKDELRRLALKKLFGDPHFNTPDPFEPFSIDLTVAEPIPPEMFAQLNQARTCPLRRRRKRKRRKLQRRQPKRRQLEKRAESR